MGQRLGRLLRRVGVGVGDMGGGGGRRGWGARRGGAVGCPSVVRRGRKTPHLAWRRQRRHSHHLSLGSNCMGLKEHGRGWGRGAGRRLHWVWVRHHASGRHAERGRRGAIHHDGGWGLGIHPGDGRHGVLGMMRGRGCLWGRRWHGGRCVLEIGGGCCGGVGVWRARRGRRRAGVLDIAGWRWGAVNNGRRSEGTHGGGGAGGDAGGE
mmetsp:Transcript_11849/g.21382  ORF Transcript_11849/g.21382 Transcript_11849/m.21382 type:complete len:208 (+) Transcript_11849:1609-2232(+)